MFKCLVDGQDKDIGVFVLYVNHRDCSNQDCSVVVTRAKIRTPIYLLF